ncbi:MAG TPA: lysophospholipid acyltransferase family protein [Myxococcaceae bacterium]|nr:lysophospholipid acyltransferase family protein [Myxococcaceae bacterium]
MRSVLFMVINAVWMTLLLPLDFLAMLVTWNKDSGVWLARSWWSPFLVRVVAGAKLTVIGLENVDPKRPTVYVSNHQSTLDIPVLFMAIPVNFRFVAKSQLRWVPVLGWYLWLGGHIFVNRSNRRSAVRSLRAAAQKIHDGCSILMYPEGTRSPDGRILPFKKGPFSLAVEAGVSVCPVTVEGTARIMPKNRWKITPGPVKVKIGKPIDARAYAVRGRDALMREVRDVVIAQSLELGGVGGDREDFPAAPGREHLAEASAP